MTDDQFDQAVQTLYAEVPVDTVALTRARRRVFDAVAPAAVRPRRQSWWPRLSAVAAAAALVAVLGATVLQREGPPTGPIMVEVARTLNAAADAEIRTVDVVVPPGQFRYIATHAQYLSSSDVGGRRFMIREGSRQEVWVPANRRDEWLMRDTDTGERTWLVGTEQAARRAGVETSVRPPTELRGKCGVWYPKRFWNPCWQSGDWQAPDEDFAASLPRDPGKLLARLRDDSAGKGNDPHQEVLVYVNDALRSGLLPADLRAALYRALALLPGLTITERAATLDGRAGTAFGITAAGSTMEIIIDPGTGDFIGERTRLAAATDGMRPGTLTASTSISYGISRAAGVRPGA